MKHGKEFKKLKFKGKILLISGNNNICTPSKYFFVLQFTFRTFKMSSPIYLSTHPHISFTHYLSFIYHLSNPSLPIFCNVITFPIKPLYWNIWNTKSRMCLFLAFRFLTRIVEQAQGRRETSGSFCNRQLGKTENFLLQL